MWLMPVSTICGLRAAGSVAHAIGVRTQIGAALDHFPRHPKLWLPTVVAVAEVAATRIAWDAAGLGDFGRVAVGVPVGSPVPNVSGHVVQAVRVRREGADRGGRAITTIRSPSEVAVPEVGEHPRTRH